MICSSVYRLPFPAMGPPAQRLAEDWLLKLHQLPGGRSCPAAMTSEATMAIADLMTRPSLLDQNSRSTLTLILDAPCVAVTQ